MSWIDVKEKREKVASLITRAGEILKDAHKEERELSAEEDGNFNQLHADAQKIKEEIRNLEMQQDAEKAIEQRIGRDDVETPEPKQNDDLAKRAFDKMLRFGSQSLTPEERAAHEQRAMSTGTATAGAEFVPEDFHNQFVEVLKHFGGVRQAGPTVITSSNGQILPVPKLDDTGNTGELIAENATADDSNADPVTGELSLNAFIYTSKIVKTSMMLAQDSAFNVQGWLAPALAKRIGRIQNTHYTSGDNSAKPEGVVVGSSLGVTAASNAAVTYNEILDLMSALDISYRSNAKLMMKDSTLLALRKLVDGNGNPLWNHGNVAAAHPDTLAGVPYVVNEDMAAIATVAKTILYGDFEQAYIIRDVIGMDLIIFNEKFKNALQIGYLGWVRSDAGTVDATAMKHLIHPV